ncbi:MAG: folate-binding protein [Bauldia sp.]
MSGLKIAELTRRGVVAVGGDGATKFLNDLVTADVGGVRPGRAVYAGLLSPQGKVLFDFIVFGDGERFLIDLARPAVGDLVKRLTFYRLRAKVTIDELSDERRVLAGWGNGEPPVDGVVAPDPRLAALGWRAIASGRQAPAGNFTPASEADYDRHRIGLGVPEGGIDFSFGEPFAHEADMDQLGGVDFDKGCYIGQEVVSRMEHRGTARRRTVIARSGGPLPPAGTPIMGGDRRLGTLMSSAAKIGLALVRLDRAREAMDAGLPVTAGETTITLALPEWARFGWPAAADRDPAP